jgi:hypothetical protein
MYLTHLLAGLAAPPPLRVDTATWKVANREAQRWLDDQEAAATMPSSELPWCGCPACPEGGEGCRCLAHYHCGGCGGCDLHCGCNQ